MDLLTSRMRRNRWWSSKVKIQKCRMNSGLQPQSKKVKKNYYLMKIKTICFFYFLHLHLTITSTQWSEIILYLGDVQLLKLQLLNTKSETAQIRLILFMTSFSFWDQMNDCSNHICSGHNCSTCVVYMCSNKKTCAAVKS